MQELQKKMHIWCRGAGVDNDCTADDDFSNEYCILCSNGKLHPMNASFKKGPYLQTPLCLPVNEDTRKHLR